MPRFYFHFKNELGRYPDDIGVELPDLETAYLEAFDAAKAHWKKSFDERHDPRGCCFEIANANGDVLLELPLSEVIGSVKRQRLIRPPASRTRARRKR